DSAQVVEGFTGRPDAIQAAILRVKLRHLDGWTARRRDIAAGYDRAFAAESWISPVRVRPECFAVYHLYVIHVPDRDALHAHLKARSITCGLHYPIPLHLQKCYAALGHARGSYPQAERSAGTLLSLPMFPEMQDEQLKAVIAGVRSFAAAGCQRDAA